MVNRYHLAAAASISLFIALAIIASPRTGHDSDSLMILDRAGFALINGSHHPFLDSLMMALTEFGREAFWTISAVLLFAFGGVAGKKTAVIVALAILSLIAIGTVSKDIIERPRPSAKTGFAADLLIPAESESDFSFPSGHAVIVSAGSAIALSLFRGSTKRLAVSLLLTLEAALVCISRIYVGSHYPFDVIGGILLGTGVALVFLGAEKKIESALVRPEIGRAHV